MLDVNVSDPKFFIVISGHRVSPQEEVEGLFIVMTPASLRSNYIKEIVFYVKLILLNIYFKFIFYYFI